MFSEKKIRFAVIGQGHIGKRHAEMIVQNPQSELVAICDVRTPEECKIAYPEVPFYSSIDELLKRKHNWMY
jgi:predicted dehydrogenase